MASPTQPTCRGSLMNFRGQKVSTETCSTEVLNTHTGPTYWIGFSRELTPHVILTGTSCSVHLLRQRGSRTMLSFLHTKSITVRVNQREGRHHIRRSILSKMQSSSVQCEEQDYPFTSRLIAFFLCFGTQSVWSKRA